MAAISGKSGAVLVPVGAPAALTDEPTTADATRTIYTITNPAHRALDKSVVPTVETSPDGTAWSPATGYRVQYPAGRVVFTAAQAAGTQVRLTGQYQPMVQSGQFTEWSADLEKDLLDSTVLGGDGWKTAVPGLRSMSGSLSGFWQDAYWFTLINTDAPIVLWLDVDKNTPARYATYAFPTKDSVGVKVTDLVTEDVDFQGDGEAVYLEG